MFWSDFVRQNRTLRCFTYGPNEKLPQYLSSINKTKDEMKDSVYQQRKHRKNKGGRYPIEDRDMVHSLKCTIKLSPFEKDRLIERAETARLSLSAYIARPRSAPASTNASTMKKENGCATPPTGSTT